MCEGEGEESHGWLYGTLRLCCVWSYGFIVNAFAPGGVKPSTALSRMPAARPIQGLFEWPREHATVQGRRPVKVPLLMHGKYLRV